MSGGTVNALFISSSVMPSDETVVNSFLLLPRPAEPRVVATLAGAAPGLQAAQPALAQVAPGLGHSLQSLAQHPFVDYLPGRPALVEVVHLDTFGSRALRRTPC